MDKDKKNTIELNIAIGLAVLVLIVVIFVFTRDTRHRETLSVEKEVPGSMQEKKSPLKKSRLPEFKPDGYKEGSKNLKENFKQEEKTQEITYLKDIPLDSISSGQEAPQRQGSEEPEEAAKSQGPSYNIQPSIEDVRKLQQKGLIIY